MCRRKRVPYIFKLSDIVVGEHIGILQVLIWVQGLSDQTLPEGAQQVQRKRHIRSDGDAQKLTEEVQQLLLGVANGAGSQDVFPLSTARNRKIKSAILKHLNHRVNNKSGGKQRAVFIHL